MTETELVEQNLDLVHFISSKYRRIAASLGESYDDLVGAGNIGLVRASQLFNPELGYTFGTYAASQIRGSILNHLRDNVPAINIPRPETELARKIHRHNLEDESPVVIASMFGCDVALVERALRSSRISIHHLQFPHPTIEGYTVEDGIGSDADFSSAHVKDFLTRLSPRDKVVIMLRLRGRNQYEIARRIGMTQMTVCRILKRIGKAYIDYREGKPVLQKPIRRYASGSYNA